MLSFFCVACHGWAPVLDPPSHRASTTWFEENHFCPWERKIAESCHKASKNNCTGNLITFERFIHPFLSTCFSLSKCHFLKLAVQCRGGKNQGPILTFTEKATLLCPFPVKRTGDEADLPSQENIQPEVVKQADVDLSAMANSEVCILRRRHRFVCVSAKKCFVASFSEKRFWLKKMKCTTSLALWRRWKKQKMLPHNQMWCKMPQKKSQQIYWCPQSLRARYCELLCSGQMTRVFLFLGPHTRDLATKKSESPQQDWQPKPKQNIWIRLYCPTSRTRIHFCWKLVLLSE